METPSIPPAAQPQQGANTTKIVIIIVAIAAGLCLVACIAGVLLFGIVGRQVSETVDTNPQDVGGTANDIAAFDLPAGFDPKTSVNMLGFKVAIYENTATDSALVFVQMPIEDELSEANIRQLQEQMDRQSGRALRNLETIDAYDATIRGEPGKVIIQQGTSESGDAYRQMLVVFQGEGGLAMMSIFGPASGWDQDTYDRLVESIR